MVGYRAFVSECVDNMVSGGIKANVLVPADCCLAF